MIGDSTERLLCAAREREMVQRVGDRRAAAAVGGAVLLLSLILALASAHALVRGVSDPCIVAALALALATGVANAVRQLRVDKTYMRLISSLAQFDDERVIGQLVSALDCGLDPTTYDEARAAVIRLSYSLHAGATLRIDRSHRVALRSLLVTNRRYGTPVDPELVTALLSLSERCSAP